MYLREIPRLFLWFVDMLRKWMEMNKAWLLHLHHPTQFETARYHRLKMKKPPVTLENRCLPPFLTGGVLAMEHSYYGLLLQLGDFGGWNVDHRLMPTHSQHRKQRTKPSIWNENLILTASKIKNEQCTRDSDEYHDRSCATRISIIETILDWPRTFCRGSRSSFTDHPFRQFRFWWPKPKSSWSCLIGRRHLLAEHWAYHDRLDSVVLQVASTIRKQHKHKRLIKQTKMS